MAGQAVPLEQGSHHVAKVRPVVGAGRACNQEHGAWQNKPPRNNRSGSSCPAHVQ
jgi:hypothetical protein